MNINLNKPVSSFSTKTNNSTITRIDNNLVKNNNNTDTNLFEGIWSDKNITKGLRKK